jgi:hypothetical protein
MKYNPEMQYSKGFSRILLIYHVLKTGKNIKMCQYSII